MQCNPINPVAPVTNTLPIITSIYDFNALEKAIARGDNSWGTAVDIAVNLYLDIINLFLDLLEILAASD